MCYISIYCYFDFIALINLVLMHHDNMRFGLLYYYCLLLKKKKRSPHYVTDSRCPHLLNRYISSVLRCASAAGGCTLIMETRTLLCYPADVTLSLGLSPLPVPLCPSLNIKLTPRTFQSHQRACHISAKFWTVFSS